MYCFLKLAQEHYVKAYWSHGERRRCTIDNFLRRTYYYDNECIYLQSLENFKLRCFFPGCKSLLIDRQELIYHMNTEHKIQKNLFRYKCTWCNLMFKQSAELQRHVKLEHRTKSVTQDSSCYSCKRCGKQFRTLKYLMYHNKDYTRVYAMVSEQGRREQPSTAEGNCESVREVLASTIHRYYTSYFIYIIFFSDALIVYNT